MAWKTRDVQAIKGAMRFAASRLGEVLFGPRKVRCSRCGRLRNAGEINIEAVIHHAAKVYECYDRKDCDRWRRRSAGPRG
jgi:hypothetical protein